MKIPVVRGLIDRRVLVNFRVDPGILRKVLPEPFRPKLAHGKGVAGVCLIRLAQIRPRVVPAFFGITSENAAHRIAVEWRSEDGRKEGVYIPRRDTSSRLTVFLGGRVFPGEHHLADFEVRETGDVVAVTVRSRDGKTRLVVEGTITDWLPRTSVFSSLEEASAFFESGSLGYSATSRPGEYDGLELRTFAWEVQPLDVSRIESSFFDNPELFPHGSAEFDCALLMRKVAHEWHGRDRLVVAADAHSRHAEGRP